MIIPVYLEEYYLQFFIFLFYICSPICESSSGVEHHLAKVRVAGSNPVFRSEKCSSGGIGRHVGLKIQ